MLPYFKPQNVSVSLRMNKVCIYIKQIILQKLKLRENTNNFYLYRLFGTKSPENQIAMKENYVLTYY